MPLLKVNMADAQDAADHFEAARCKLPSDAPIIFCIHGYKFSPQSQRHNPHDHILALKPTAQGRKVISWPRALGFENGSDAEGLCVAVGWHARRSIWSSYKDAALIGAQLAALIQRADRPVALIGHSLGARVILTALPHLTAQSVSRAVLLSAAEFQDTGLHALASPAGQSAEILNITSRENDLYDVIAELMLSPTYERSLGAGLIQAHSNWCDIQIDDKATRANLRAAGVTIAPSERRVCHWSSYTRGGVFDLYRAFLRGHMSLRALKALVPYAPEPRFARFMPKDLPSFGVYS